MPPSTVPLPSLPPLPPEQVLLLEDDPQVRTTVAEKMRQAGFAPLLAATLAAAEDLVRTNEPALYLVDIHLPDGSGISLLRRIRAEDPDVPVVMMTGHGSIQTAVEVTRLGATEYLPKPFDPEELVLLVRRAVDRSRDSRELRHRRQQAASGYEELTGRSRQMRRLFSLLKQIEIADTSTILIQGESGTGKELVARAIHRRSARSRQPFLEIDCTGLDDQLVQSELFGHEQGAFTDAKHRKAGLFEVAGRGTILLDEIGELGLQTQSKLLRALENHRFKRVGGTKDLVLRARVLAATNLDLAEQVANGRFREDLYYRLAVIPVILPPLRDREGDIPLLVEHLTASLAQRLGRKPPVVTPEAMALLEAYHWPGNARELRNVLERAMVLHPGPITPHDLPIGLGRVAHSDADLRDGNIRLPAGGLDLADLEASLIAQALERAGGSRTEAGRLLGLSRFSLRYRAKKAGLLDRDSSNSQG